MNRHRSILLILLLALVAWTLPADDEIPAHRAKQIYDAAPAKARIVPKQPLRVLLSLDPARSNMGVKWINRKDNDFALAWVKSYNQGRVFNTSFGHRTELFWDPRVLEFLGTQADFSADYDHHAAIQCSDKNPLLPCGDTFAGCR